MDNNTEVEEKSESESETNEINMNSILTSVKKMIGPAEDYTFFDPDLIVHINSVFTILTQIGVGPEEGFSIKDTSSLWTDFLPDSPKLEAVKSFMYLKVRLLFDPPASSAAIESASSLAEELQWRILVAADPYPETEESEEK